MDAREAGSQPGLENTGEAPPGLTQAPQHDPNGAEVGKSAEGVRREDFCSDLKTQTVGEEGLPSDRTPHHPAPWPSRHPLALCL